MYNRGKNAPMQGSKLEKNSTTSGIAKPIVKKPQNVTEKLRQSNPPRLTPKQTPPHRSLSQPSSSTTLTRQNYRPRSGGDENEILVRKFNQNRLVSEQSEDEDCESIQYLKDNVEQYSDRKNPDDVDSKYSSSVKASASGIPLRIKSNVITPKAPTRKTPSRLTKPNSQVLYSPNRGGSKAPLSNDSKAVITASPRVLEMQFQTKRKKMELLKKEVIDKQNNLIDMHQALSQIQKKLEESGGKSKCILEDFRVVNFGELNKVQSTSDELSLVGSANDSKSLDPEMVQRMKDTVRQIPFSLLQVCKNLMDKRLHLIDILRKMSNSHSESDIINHVESLKEETANLESMLDETFNQQEKHVSELVDKWQILLQGNGDYSNFSDRIEQLQEKLKQKEEKLTEVLCEMQDVRKKNDEDIVNTKAEVTVLKNKIKLLESDQNQDKALVQDHKDKNTILEQKLKLLKNRSREVDQSKKDAESKYTELQKQHRQLTEQLKANEQKWTKEKDEILTKNKHDRQMLDKLTKDRSYFETRLKTLEELAADWENKYHVLEAKAFNEVEEARKAMTEEVVNRETMQQKYDNIKDQLVQMEIRRKQAIDLVNTKNTFEPNETEGISTEREAELYTELLATRVALKAAEEQIRNYNREKLRFIDSLQTLDEDRDGEYMTTTLVKSVEKLTELEAKLAKSEETICFQKIEIAGLKVDSESLKQRSNIALCNVETSDAESKDSDLKRMLHEGRMKLEQSLKKSLEYEHRIIKYEHEINKQNKQILEMENLMKVRDGLISLMKAKKDELQMENESLNKYANEIRDLLLQAKEDARNRTEMVQELSTNLDSRGRICQQLEKKVKDLEGSLVVTNEKRFKLQDSLGLMERELQLTKEHITKLAPEIHSRYGIDITASNSISTSNLPEKGQPSNKVFNPQVSVVVEPPSNSTCQLPTQFPMVVPSNNLCCCNFVSDGKNVAKVNRTASKKNALDNLEDIEKALVNLNVTLEPYSTSMVKSQVSNQLVKDKPNDYESCHQIDDLQSKLKKNSPNKSLAKLQSTRDVIYQYENYRTGVEATLGKMDAKSKNLNMAYANLNFSSDEDCKSSQNLIDDKKIKMSEMLDYPQNIKCSDLETSEDRAEHDIENKATVKQHVKYRVRNVKDNFLKKRDSDKNCVLPLQSNQKKLKKVYDHIVGESNSRSSGVFKCESVTKRKRKYHKKGKIHESAQPTSEPPKSKKSVSKVRVSLNRPNTYLGGHNCRNHKLPLEMYLHCHHADHRDDSSSSTKTTKRSTGSKPSSPGLQRESKCGSKSRTETLLERERRKSNSFERKEISNTKTINPVLIERTNFINHARNISRHFDNQRKRVKLADFDDLHSNILDDKILSIDSFSLKSTEMEGDNVLINCDFMTQSMNRLKSKGDKKLLLSKNLSKTDSEMLRTTDSLPYL